jgi:hypothetical protein
MLSDTAKLYFPKLVFDKAVTVTHNVTNEIKPINLYRLDWTRKINKCNGGKPELSSEYEELLASLRFAISDGYIKEIRRCSRLAVHEWNTLRLLDTSLKLIYLLPAASYIEVAFRLLSDSAFDETKGYYYRKENKIILPYLLLYKFWKNQGTNAITFKFAQFSELLTISMNDNLQDYEMVEINKFLTYIDKDLGGKKEPPEEIKQDIVPPTPIVPPNSEENKSDSGQYYDYTLADQ